MKRFELIVHMFTYLLNEDLALSIVEHCAAYRIMSALRTFAYRHTRTYEWPTIRCLLSSLLIESRSFDSLQKTLWIRKEWLTEPASWLYMLAYENTQIWYILQEVSSDCGSIIRAPATLFHLHVG